MLGVHNLTLARWRMQGIGPAFVKLSRRAVRYSETAIHEWIQSNAIPTEVTKVVRIATPRFSNKCEHCPHPMELHVAVHSGDTNHTDCTLCSCTQYPPRSLERCIENLKCELENISTDATGEMVTCYAEDLRRLVEFAEAREGDTYRIDWMQWAYVQILRPDPNDEMQWDVTAYNAGAHGKGKTLREAIDAAISSESES